MRLAFASMHRSLPLLVSTTLLSLVAACSDPTKVSAEKAQVHTDELAKLAEKDVGEIRAGLPKGSKKLTELLFADGKEVTPGSARAAMKKAREAVSELQLAKSTFFAVTDPSGQAWANNQETDAMSGKNLVTAFKGLEKAKTEYVELMGSMEEAKGVKTGDDVQWVAGAPITAGDGSLKGLFVTGWSMRRFAYHLEEQLKTDFRHEATKAGTPANKLPLVYAFVMVGDKAYAAPLTPEVNTKAVEGLGLAGKVQEGSTISGKVDITNRGFGWAARKVKALCDSCAVVVLRSEV